MAVYQPDNTVSYPSDSTAPVTPFDELTMAVKDLMQENRRLRAEVDEAQKLLKAREAYADESAAKLAHEVRQQLGPMAQINGLVKADLESTGYKDRRY